MLFRCSFLIFALKIACVCVFLFIYATTETTAELSPPAHRAGLVQLPLLSIPDMNP